jgi:hypothetical protein
MSEVRMQGKFNRSNRLSRASPNKIETIPDDSTSNTATSLKDIARIWTSTSTTTLLSMASATPTGPSEEVVLTSDVQRKEKKRRKLKRLEVSKRKVPEPEQSHAKSLVPHVQASPFPLTLHI